MPSSSGPKSEVRDSDTHREPTRSEDDHGEEEQSEEEDGQDPVSQQPESRQDQKRTKPGEPAYVAPIPKIGPISPVSPISSPSAPDLSGIPALPTNRPPLPKFVGSFLVGKTVDESGDIVDDETGQVLARAAGDLPSIVGRKISNNKGDILGDDGELLGYVEDLNIEKQPIPGTGTGSSPPRFPPMKTLAEIMARANASLMVDHMGNILDTNGDVVGKFHDNNNPEHRKEREEQERAKRATESTPAFQAAAAAAAKSASGGTKPEPASASSDPQPDAPSAEGEPKRKYERRTEEERRENAQAWRKEAPGESPSDIFLDVKSTTEGIQLTIRIPTVFGNGQQVRPNISFS